MHFFSIIIFALLIIGTISFFITIFNRLVLLKNNIEKAFANIDVILKQRADEIPNLIKVVKEYVKYEQSVLEQLTKLRTDYTNSTNTSDKVKIANEMDKTIQKIMAVAENYPDLKANNSFVELQKRVSGLEDAIADRREFFNESVNLYNIGIQEFPNFVLAKMLGYAQKNMLYISEKEKKYDGIEF